MILEQVLDSILMQPKRPGIENYRMYSYITQELQALVSDNFPIDCARQGITGHSMGGHGALTIGLKNPHLFRSIICLCSDLLANPVSMWGQKALGGYLGDDGSAWTQYDAVELIRNGYRSGEILVDQGEADNFLQEQLKPELLSSVCVETDQPLQLRMQPGYDHSYYFIASFIEDHIAFHASNLN